VTDPPLIEVLYSDGCPSQERLLPTVQRLAEHTGARLELRAVETLEAAESERFLGSPTVRVNGQDVDADASERTDYGLKCRLYRDDGTQSPTPPEDWIRAVLSRARTPDRGVIR
jgi:hypothetical protein